MKAVALCNHGSSDTATAVSGSFVSCCMLCCMCLCKHTVCIHKRLQGARSESVPLFNRHLSAWLGVVWKAAAFVAVGFFVGWLWLAAAARSAWEGDAVPTKGWGAED